MNSSCKIILSFLDNTSITQTYSGNIYLSDFILISTYYEQLNKIISKLIMF